MSLQCNEKTECTIVLPKDKTLLFNSILATLVKKSKGKK